MSRPSYELYELWTFLAVSRLLQHEFPGHSWTSRGLTHLRSLGAGIAGGELSGTAGDSELRLLFNPTFRGYLVGREDPRFSISRERRPDIVLAWKSNQGAGWAALDAKYRVQPEYLAAAFESAHLYRDSLRWSEYGGRCQEAVLLVPSEVSACSPWFSADFRRENHVGVFVATPGDDDRAQLATWLRALVSLQS